MHPFVIRHICIRLVLKYTVLGPNDSYFLYNFHFELSTLILACIMEDIDCLVLFLVLKLFEKANNSPHIYLNWIILCKPKFCGF